MASLRGYFLSDLHLFSNRSEASRYSAMMEAAAEQAHTMILGGDIFDFKWSRHSSLEHSISEAIEWIENLLVSYPLCSFYYLLGNHDAHPDFVAALDRLAFRRRNLEWQPYVLRLGHCVFLHGDVIDGGVSHQAVDERRHRHGADRSPPPFRHWLYDVVVRTRAHRFVATVVNRHDWVLAKLFQYLSEQGLDASRGVTDVYFGHTHREVHGLVYNGLRFHNGGAAIKGLGFRIVETCLELRVE